MTPKILLVSTCNWLASARIALAFADAGCDVSAAFPRRHPLTRLRGVVNMSRYSPARPISSIVAAIETACPDLVVPCDDLATAHLHQLFEVQRRDQPTGSAIAELLERSLGPSTSFLVTGSRSRLLALARDEGIRTPETELTSTHDELDTWLGRNGLPAVLKADGTFSGGGVRVVATAEQAHRALDELGAPPSMAKAAKHVFVYGDGTFVGPWLRRKRFAVSVQRFVSGHDANIAVACWQGKTLASVGVHVLQTRVPLGPSSLVQVVENHEMALAATRVVAKLGLTGLFGLDFVVDARTGEAFLIEMNPRATQTCHLRLGAGRDLPGSLTQALTGMPASGNTCLTTHSTIALFPQELQRDPTGAMLATAYHDVPWDQPELVQEALIETLEIRRRALKRRIQGTPGPRHLP